ncbi:MAG: hypothetical protein R2698_02765 [Microthrixaceae bacterium]
MGRAAPKGRVAVFVAVAVVVVVVVTARRGGRPTPTTTSVPSTTSSIPAEVSRPVVQTCAQADGLVTRECDLYLPSNPPSHAMPAVVLLHGLTGSPAGVVGEGTGRQRCNATGSYWSHPRGSWRVGTQGDAVESPEPLR